MFCKLFISGVNYTASIFQALGSLGGQIFVNVALPASYMITHPFQSLTTLLCLYSPYTENVIPLEQREVDQFDCEKCDLVYLNELVGAHCAVLLESEGILVIETPTIFWCTY